MAGSLDETSSLLDRTVYVGTFIYCASLTELDVLENVAVGVDEKGIITFLEHALTHDLEDRIRARGWGKWKYVRQHENSVCFWFPGFIDTHIHASQFPNAGIFGKTTLMSWLEKYTFPLEASLASISKARTVYTNCVSRTLANGTTTASYYATTHVASTNLLADICKSLGQRAFIGRCGMDSNIQPEYYRDVSPRAAIEATKATIAHIRSIDPENSLITPIITPRFAPSCTPEFMSLLGNLHRETNIPIQTHLSENDNEIQLVKEMFPQHAHYAGVYDDHGLLTPRTILAHAIHLSSSEQSLIQKRGCSVSHCPASNSYLGSGICKVRELLDAGITVGLGTDISGGYSPSILAAAREAGGVSRLRSTFTNPDAGQVHKDNLKLSIEETLCLATRGGAKCLGLEKRVGAFEVGMEWDAQFIDLGRVMKMDGEEGTHGGRGNVQVWDYMDWEEKIAKWVICGDDRNTKAVWVAGRLVSGDMEK